MMAQNEKVAIIGLGSWGTALGNVFADAGANVTLWGRDSRTVIEIASAHKNEKYLKDIELSPRLRASSNLEELVATSSIIVCAIPTQQIRSVFAPLKKLLKKKHILNVCKGIEIGTNKRVSEIFAELAPTARYSILSGPSFAQETAQRLPTAVTLASKEKKEATKLQKMLATPYFRTYTATDVVGVEFAGALKNVVAIAAGVVAGLRLGYNAQAALINRGIAEIIRMGKKRGAKPLTFLGLSGMGDLILTCTGPLSRNRKLGVLLGEGKNVQQSLHELGGVAEGFYTAKSAIDLAKKLKVEMPITKEVYRMLYENSTPQQALANLMSRDLTTEW